MTYQPHDPTTCERCHQSGTRRLDDGRAVCARCATRYPDEYPEEARMTTFAERQGDGSGMVCLPADATPEERYAAAYPVIGPVPPGGWPQRRREAPAGDASGR